MNWQTVRLIYCREIRDQLRDRRTLFMIAVLPLLLYPLLGMSVFQLSQFLRTSEPRVVIAGSEQLVAKGLPTLTEDGHFAVDLFDSADDAKRISVEFKELETAQQMLADGTTDVRLHFSSDFAQPPGAPAPAR